MLSATTDPRSFGLAFTALLLATGLAVALSLNSGTISFTVSEVVRALFGQAQGPQILAFQVIRNIRLPRALVAALCGMNLAVAGCLLQAVLRNPLASPNIIGVSAGAGFFAVLVMVVLPGHLHFVPPAAFAGALGAAALVYALAAWPRALDAGGGTVTIILAGVAISALLNAITSGIMVLHSDDLDVTYTWLIGGLSGRSWNHVALVAPYSLPGIVLAIFLSPKLNLFPLGDEMGSGLGSNIGALRFLFIALAAALAGSAVSVAGTIGFVGLVAPHISRLVVGNDSRVLLPFSALMGAFLLLVADLCARTVFMPVELPVGVVTAALGAPFFILLLVHRGREGGHGSTQ
ncbi:iron complex transport system permease protein [Alkalispirochaeta americana]|uniref:Iron complex transport system permease protein n=1 Tax=Alkalispirochaeta americana TaxID=159291 RepID=A0A1N6PVE9_9SPIO|nr:iron ABC transporter permease [Alkalispirochaeta americana]SIQ08255.1 iron complex transport system permease protein [Alkalispirochaeta americana]